MEGCGMKELTDVRKEPRVRAHNIVVDNRERISITGVTDVISFNETDIEIETDAGGLAIFGQNLRFNKLNLEDGQMVVDGFIEGFEYTDIRTEKGGFLSRIFK
jgi:sporulation protein YabP